MRRGEERGGRVRVRDKQNNFSLNITVDCISQYKTLIHTEVKSHCAEGSLALTFSLSSSTTMA